MSDSARIISQQEKLFFFMIIDFDHKDTGRVKRLPNVAAEMINNPALVFARTVPTLLCCRQKDRAIKFPILWVGIKTGLVRLYGMVCHYCQPLSRPPDEPRCRSSWPYRKTADPTQVYAMIQRLNVLFTYGLETASISAGHGIKRTFTAQFPFFLIFQPLVYGPAVSFKSGK